MIAENIRSEIEGLCIPHEDSSHKNVTVSMGVSTFAGDINISHVQLFEKADKALYEAKETGRNKIVAV